MACAVQVQEVQGAAAVEGVPRSHHEGYQQVKVANQQATHSCVARRRLCCRVSHCGSATLAELRIM